MHVRGIGNLFGLLCFLLDSVVHDWKEANVVVSKDVSLLPVVHYHALGAVWCACAAAIANEVDCTRLKPSAVRVVTVNAMMLDTAPQIVAHRQSASSHSAGTVRLILLLVFKARRALFLFLFIYLLLLLSIGLRLLLLGLLLHNRMFLLLLWLYLLLRFGLLL